MLLFWLFVPGKFSGIRRLVGRQWAGFRRFWFGRSFDGQGESWRFSEFFRRSRFLNRGNIQPYRFFSGRSRTRGWRGIHPPDGFRRGLNKC